ncbi:MAG: DUF423 domain-containing protein [Desulfobacterales bacterium]|nr:DUF423 domain-containing protein [Desulfobacterales bacterium]
MFQFLIAAGALGAALSVILGAFGAHGLKTRLAPEMLAIFETGVQYQFYHSLGLILVGIIFHTVKASTMVSAAGGLMLAGIFLFSGSLYLICLTGVRSFGMIAPFGGTAFIAAWVLLAIGVLRS